MNQKEREQVERELILDILIESTKWRIDNDADDAIRLEVCLRARRLLGIEEIPVEPQSVVERGLARAAARQPRESHAGKIRIYENGKTRWVNRELCEQVPNIHSKTGLKWVLKSEVKDEPAN
jgi:hypothetical protein